MSSRQRRRFWRKATQSSLAAPPDQRSRGLRVEHLEDRRLLAGADATTKDALGTLIGGSSIVLPSPMPLASVTNLPPGQQGSSSLSDGPSAEALSFVLNALDEYVSAPDPNFRFELANTFSGDGFDGYVLKLTSQEWRTTDEVNRTLWQHWLILAVPHALDPDSNTALLAITGGNNNSTTPPSRFSISELGAISLVTGTVVAELRMVPNQPLTFTANGEDAATFVVPGGPGETADMTIHFDGASGSFLTSFGFFDVSQVSADPVLAPRDYALQAISNATIAFDERADPIGSTFVASVPRGTELGFFILPNDSVDDFLANPDEFYGPQATRRAPLFSLPDANPGQFDQMQAMIRNGTTSLSFEDLTRIPGGGSNQNFADVQISISTELQAVPLPEGNDYFGRARTEDAIIAYSFDQYLLTGDDTWPALLPMVKSAVRAMDAVQQYVPTVAPGAQIDDFVVSGGSKRGWTTWLTAAADAATVTPRVKAIIPLVFDVLNVEAQLDHHQEYYEGVTASMIGGYSNALKDYTELDIFGRRHTPEGEALLSIVDPYAYRDRLTLPKFMINSTGDEFFVPDSGQFYLSGLSGQNYVRYVPNTNHDVLDNSDAAESLLEYYIAIVYDQALPQFSWTVEDDGETIRVQSSDTPLQVNLWQATNYDSRDFRGSVTGIPWTSSPLEEQGAGGYVAHMPTPNLGATAFFIELVFPGTLYDFKFTTQVSVVSAAVQTPIEPWLVPQLVDDVNTDTFPSDAASLTDVNGTLFFTAVDPLAGRELWKSDGTAAGTVRVADIFPGPSWSNPRYLTSFHGTLLFIANDPTLGGSLWKSDGTAAGTTRVAGLDSAFSSPAGLTVVGDAVFFSAYDSSHGRELWKTDGTTEGTVFVADVHPASPYGYPRSSYPQSLTAVGDTLFFTAQDDIHGRELWKSDGTAEGTVLVVDARPTSPYGYPRSSNPQNLTAVGDRLFFTAYDDEHGSELWTSDGSEDGTMLVEDILPNGNYGFARSSDPTSLTAVDGILFFTANDGVHGRELWKSNGTPEGTLLVADVRPGSPYGYPRSSDPRYLEAVDGVLYFTAVDNQHGRELWKSDGSADGTVLVANIVQESPYFGRGSYPENLTAVNGTLFFTARDDDHGRELWRTDGSAAGAVFLKDIRLKSNPGNPSASSYPSNLTAVGDELFFLADDGVHGQELWKSTGTTAGTLLVKDVRDDTVGSYPFSFTDVGGVLYFLVNNDAQQVELWRTDGTSAGAQLVADYWSQNAVDQLTSVGGRLFFTASDSEHGRELWTSDGTAAGTRMVVDILPNGPNGTLRGSYPSNLTNFNGTLYFTATDDEHGNELWRSDGTAAGTLLAADIRPTSSYGVVHGSYPNELIAVGGLLFFTALDGEHGRELWASDGTAEGTLLVADIRSNSAYGGVRGSEPLYLTALGGRLFFTAFDDEHGRELWSSDGTAEGTLLVADIRTGSPYGYPSSSYPADLTVVGGNLYFSARDVEHGRELWQSDGTPDGTRLVANLAPGNSGSYPDQLTESHGELFFAYHHPLLGRELWKSDGTPQGTLPVKNIRAGAGSSYPSQLTDINGTLFFVANDGQHGTELWQSDGTIGGTVMVADSRPGSSGSYPGQLTNVGGTLFFSVSDPLTGSEPWMLVQPVEVNIRPYLEPNLISLNSWQRVTVAILGTEALDTSQIDRKSLKLAGADVAPWLFGLPDAWLYDVNGDGRLDLIAKFPIRNLELSATDTSVLLEGKLVSGQRIQGTDRVTIVGPPRPNPATAPTNASVVQSVGDALGDVENTRLEATRSGVPAGALAAWIRLQAGLSATSVLHSLAESAIIARKTTAQLPLAPVLQATLKLAAVDAAIHALTSVTKPVPHGAVLVAAPAKAKPVEVAVRGSEPARDDLEVENSIAARMRTRRLAK